MITHIDVNSVLRRIGCDLYSNLVTRSTGVAVRTEIEQQLAELGGRALTVIDFSHVGLIDFSCADEIVAKLVLQACTDSTLDACYFVFRGVSETHLDAIETVLEKRGLALVVQLEDGAATLVGTVDDAERVAWEALYRLGGADLAELARVLDTESAELADVVERLCRRRLVMRHEEAFVAVGSAA